MTTYHHRGHHHQHGGGSKSKTVTNHSFNSLYSLHCVPGWRGKRGQQALPSYARLDIGCSHVTTKTTLVGGVQWCLCSVSVCAVCADVHWELPQQCPQWSVHCVYTVVWMTSITTGGLNRPRHPGGFPQCYEKDAGGLDCMNNTLFTPY